MTSYNIQPYVTISNYIITDYWILKIANPMKLTDTVKPFANALKFLINAWTNIADTWLMIAWNLLSMDQNIYRSCMTSQGAKLCSSNGNHWTLISKEWLAESTFYIQCAWAQPLSSYLHMNCRYQVGLSLSNIKYSLGKLGEIGAG